MPARRDNEPVAARFNGRQFDIFDHFTHYNTADAFTTVAESTGTVAVVAKQTATQPGLALRLRTAATNNDSAGVRTTNKPFLFGAGYPFEIWTRINMLEAATSAANILFGVHDAYAAALHGADGAGLTGSAYYAAFQKNDGGGQNWEFVSNLAGTRKLSVCRAASPDSATLWQTLGITVSDQNGEIIITPWLGSGDGSGIDDVELLLDTDGKIIQHRWTSIGTPASMNGFVSVAAGTAAVQDLYVDYIAATQQV